MSNRCTPIISCVSLAGGLIKCKVEGGGGGGRWLLLVVRGVVMIYVFVCVCAHMYVCVCLVQHLLYHSQDKLAMGSSFFCCLVFMSTCCCLSTVLWWFMSRAQENHLLFLYTSFFHRVRRGGGRGGGGSGGVMMMKKIAGYLWIALKLNPTGSNWWQKQMKDLAGKYCGCYFWMKSWKKTQPHQTDVGGWRTAGCVCQSGILVVVVVIAVTCLFVSLPCLFVCCFVLCCEKEVCWHTD